MDMDIPLLFSDLSLHACMYACFQVHTLGKLDNNDSSYNGLAAYVRFRSLDRRGYIRSVNVLEPNAWMEKVFT